MLLTANVVRQVPAYKLSYRPPARRQRRDGHQRPSAAQTGPATTKWLPLLIDAIVVRDRETCFRTDPDRFSTGGNT